MEQFLQFIRFKATQRIPLSLFFFTFKENPGCLFEQDHCNWTPSGTWLISKFFPLRFSLRDWQGTGGRSIVINDIDA